MTTGATRLQRWQANIIRAAAVVVRWIIEPSSRVEPEQRWRTRMLTVFLLIMSINTAAGMLILKKVGGNAWVVLEATSATMFLSYLISRTRYYRAALVVAITLPALPPLAIALFKPPEVNLSAELMWLALPLMVACLMLAMRHIIIVVASYISFIIALSAFGLMELKDLAPVMAFLSIITFFVIAISVIWKKYQTEKESQLVELKHAEILLRDNNEQLDTVLNSVPCGIIVVDEPTHTIHDVNTFASNLFGASAEEIIGKECHRFIYPAERGKCPITDLGKPAAIAEQALINSRGNAIPILKNVARVTMKGSHYLLETFVDITPQKHMEAALKESEDSILKAFRAIPEAVSIATLKDGVFLEVNDSFLLLNGYTREEVIGHTAKELNIWAHSSDRYRIKQLMDKQGRFENEEFLLRRKSGETRIVLLSADVINFGGKPCILTIGNDITERKKMEQALQESEEKFSTAFHASPAIIAITTFKDGRYIDVNNSYIQATGYTSKELVGRTTTDVKIWAKPEDHTKLFKILNEHGRASNEEFNFRMKSGEIRTWLFSAERINIAGELCLIGVSVDITEHKKAEEKLKEAMTHLEHSSSQLATTNKELEAFSYSVSHDLRSPLRSIDGFSQALLEDYRERLDEKGQDYLRRLRGASQKMGELIDGILKLSRLTRSEMHHEPINLSALAGEIAGRLQEMQPKRKVIFLIDKELTANGDPQLLRVLLENLLGNAWKFTSKQPQAQIEFSMERNNGKKAYFIRDNGAGFDMTYADKLFGAFQRLHDVSEFPGTGIGLATVQRIIHRHGGTIWAEGTVGKGATFHFTLD